MRVIQLARADPGFLFERFKKLESPWFMFSSNVAGKSHHAGVVWNKTDNKC